MTEACRTTKIALAALLLAAPASLQAGEVPLVPLPLALGAEHGCAVTEEQKVVCWGKNTEGQLGDGSSVAESTAVEVFALTNATAVAAGEAHSCAIVDNGQVKCWGRARDGQLGGGQLFSSARYLAIPIQVEPLKGATALALGGNHSCALTTGGDVFCWGLNLHGQVGGNLKQPEYSPVRIAGLRDVRQIGAGEKHTCALTHAGEVYCWGLNESGQLGIGNTENKTEPTRIETLPRAVSLAVGGNHACATDETGRTFCWGNNSDGQLGCGYMVDYLDKPAAVVALSETTRLSLGSKHSCALLASGEVRCWGDGGSGQIGNGRRADYLIPTPSGARSAWWIASGGERTCGVSGRGSVSCWGGGQISPSSLRMGARVQSEGHLTGAALTSAPIQGGRAFTCGLFDDGRVACWGSNEHGQLGRGTTGGNHGPDWVNGISDAMAISAGGHHACAVLDDTTVKCWGHGGNGEIGNGATTSANPVAQPVNGLSGVLQLSGGENYHCALKESGRITCWGYNGHGQLGDGTTHQHSSPTPEINLPAPAIAIAAGYEHACAIVEGGSAYCWGRANYGRLGNGGTSSSPVPVPVTGMTGAVAISAGHQHTCVLKEDGTVWCWGDNSYGILGDGTTQSRSTPVQVAGLSGVTQVAVGNHSTCALKADGTLWCWGHGAYGDLGLGSTNSHHTPMQVASLGEISALGEGGWNGFAVLADGSVRGWGYNHAAELGLGPSNTSNQLVPVTIPLPGRVQTGLVQARSARRGASGSQPDAQSSGRTEPENPTRPEDDRDDGERYDDRF